VTLIATCSRQYFDHRLLAGACKSLLSIEFPGKATLESDRKENRLIFLRMRVFGGHNARLRTSGNRSDTNQRGERMSEWLRPILGAALLLAGAHPTQATTVPVDVAAPAQGAASAAQTGPTTAPPAASGDTLAIASRAASNVVLPAEAQDNPACVPIKAEQREIEGGLKKQYSPEQGRFMQRRLRELAEQSVNLNCAE